MKSSREYSKTPSNSPLKGEEPGELTSSSDCFSAKEASPLRGGLVGSSNTLSDFPLKGARGMGQGAREDQLSEQSSCSLPPAPCPSLGVLLLQEDLERQCWLQANRMQTAPAQRMTDFVNGRLSADLNESSYAPGLIASPLHFWLPEFISSRLREAFKLWGKQKHGFLTSEATVIGIETRTSSPVRILRDNETLQHIRVEGLFPCGEGAGYAGGIVSAGVDGERCAEALARYMSENR